ncbi:MAG: TylF/MycF/NovP-related O-methyltransferase [Candidatus Helarchaeota archaeon]
MAIDLGVGLLKKENYTLEYWLVKEGYRKSPEISKDLLFLRKISSIFDNIYKKFNKTNPMRINKKDYKCIQSSPQELLYIARTLYILHSYGIKGDVIECGCFKGFSACCLSWVCDFLGKKLYVADSFQGLPKCIETLEKKTYYDIKDFKGNFKEVKENIKQFGKIASVKFIKGWFNKTLRKFQEPLCIIWMDVDLYQSAKDILTNLFANLSKNGVIFSHEFAKYAINQDGKIKSSKFVDGPMRAIAEFFEKNKINYKAKYLRGDLGIIIPHINKNESILLSLENQFLLEKLLGIYRRKFIQRILFKIKNIAWLSLIRHIISRNRYFKPFLAIGYFLSQFF